METRHPVGLEGSWWWISVDLYEPNHCGVTAAWSRKTLKNIFLEKNDPLRGNFHDSVPKGFIATPIAVLCSNFVKFYGPEVSEIVRCLLGKKIRMALQLSLLRGLRPKSARASPQQCTQSAPHFIQIGSLSAELWAYQNAIKTGVKFFQYWASSRIKIAASDGVRSQNQAKEEVRTTFSPHSSFRIRSIILPLQGPMKLESFIW